jgi:hypothetical protein
LDQGHDNDWDKEEQAYAQTEQWTIDNGLGGQGDGSMRKNDPVTGALVIDQDAVHKFVMSQYPIPPSGDRIVAINPDDNTTQIIDGVTGETSWRPSKLGDKIPGQEQATDLQTTDPAQWTCGK